MIKIKPYKEIKPFKERNKPKFIHPDGEIIYGTILDEIEIEHGDLKGKFYKYLVQKILYDDRSEEFRFCYYYINFSNPNAHWIFAQFALTLTKEQYLEFHKRMQEKGWI
ncbi:hypothetical protein LCGC14_2007560 [marine sediment metagenome]|uniref:Uncharacterized protein n=1 Tax=marine sediment metagenome TaxID=412755 RepID=A0A0F9HYC4_9ZZZZ